MKNLTGQTLGQYKLVDQIGQGSMATVFKARQAGLERWVAVKVLHRQYALDPEARNRFLQEAQAIANLEHPHILPVYDFGEHDDYIYLVMRYIDSSLTLADVMHAPFSLDQALNYLEQIAAALDYAHRQGMIHRDVKPANILLKEQWVFLADFGLVRLMEGATQITSTHVGTGTPAYMSPEQGAGGKIDPRTDVYAVGVMAYEMLTGQIPHLADTVQAMIYKRNHEPPPAVRDARPEIPIIIDLAVQKALATQPAHRFRTTGAFVTALREATQETNVSSVMETLPSLRAVDQAPAGRSSPAPTTATPQVDASPPTVASPQVAAPPGRTRRREILWLGGGLALLVFFIIAFTLVWLVASGGGAGQPTQAGNLPTTAAPAVTPTLTATTGEAFFFEDFDGIGLEQKRWQLLTRGGQVQVANSLLRLNSVGQTFPLVYPRRNPFPAEGNFRLTVSLRYLKATEWGAGFWLGAPGEEIYAARPNDEVFLDRRIIALWQNAAHWRIDFGRENEAVYTLPAPELDLHDLEINYISNRYQVVVDGQEVYVSEPTTVRPTIFWIGAPTHANAGSAWSGLEVDLIAIEPLADSLTLGDPATPAAAPAAALTPTPTATLPPTLTPTPLGQNCAAETGQPFTETWQAYRQLLGCPTGEARTIPTIAEELFQGGHTFWRSDTDRVYIIYDRDQASGIELGEGEWQPANPDWKWDGDNPDGVGLSPPAGLVEPKRGFGWLWRTHLNGPDGPLGWALDREYGFDNLGQAQQFEQGLMFKGSGPKIYVLLENGTFYARN